MYYTEKVIDGRLHYRKSPYAEWIPMEPETLTWKLKAAEDEIKRLNNIIEGE